MDRQILNPATGKLVSIDSKTGQKLLKLYLDRLYGGNNTGIQDGGDAAANGRRLWSVLRNTSPKEIAAAGKKPMTQTNNNNTGGRIPNLPHASDTNSSFGPGFSTPDINTLNFPGQTPQTMGQQTTGMMMPVQSGLDVDINNEIARLGLGKQNCKDEFKYPVDNARTKRLHKTLNKWESFKNILQKDLHKMKYDGNDSFVPEVNSKDCHETAERRKLESAILQDINTVRDLIIKRQKLLTQMERLYCP